jgi:hypothetical protein
MVLIKSQVAEEIVGLEFENLFFVVVFLFELKFVIDFSHKKVWPKFDNISFVVIFVFVLFNSYLSCSRISFVYEMNILQNLLFY